MNTYFITGEEYDIQYQGYKEDLNFYLSEMKKSKSTLEIGCGTGRILLPALEKGYNIEGLDDSKGMLKELKRKSKEKGHKVKTYFADMKNFKTTKKYDLIIVPFRAFLHLINAEDQKKSLVNFNKHLKKGGKLILNFFNPNYERMVTKHGKTEFLSVVKDPITKNKIKLYANNFYFPSIQTLKTTFIHEEVDKHNLPVAKRKYNLKLRYIFRYEFEHLLALTGFKPVKLFGDFNKSNFTDKSREMIWVCKKG